MIGPDALGFVCAVADEGDAQLEFFLTHFRRAYPRAPLAVVSDGVDDPAYPTLCQRYGAVYRLGRFLKRIECGGTWWRRTLTIGLDLGTPYIVKVDPDTRFWRPFTSGPQFAVSGAIDWRGTHKENVLGGCQAITRDAARLILKSRLLSSPELRRHDVLAADKDWIFGWTPSGYLGTDASLIYLCRRLRIPWGTWPEAEGVAYRNAPDNTDLRYAVTHPHKLPRRYYDDDEPLRIVTTCKDRLDHLRQTLPGWLAEPHVSVTVVDWECGQGAADWVRENYPAVTVVKATGDPRFHLSRARNVGAAATPDAGWLCFFDADLLTAPGWSRVVRRALRPNSYHTAGPLRVSLTGSVVVPGSAFRAVGGYDELIRGWAPEDLDLYARLRHVGVRPATYPSSCVASIKHDDGARVQHYALSKSRSRRLFGEYYALKLRRMTETRALPVESECRYLLSVARDRSGVRDDAGCDYESSACPSICTTVYPGGAGPSWEAGVPVAAKEPYVPRPRVLVINRSWAVSDAEGLAWTKACQRQLDEDVARHWFKTASLTYVTKNQAPHLGAWCIYLLDDAEQATTHGYGGRTPSDLPSAYVLAGDVRAAGALPSVALSALVISTVLDPTCAGSFDASPGGHPGTRFAAFEPTLPVGDDRYAYAIDGTPLSDFVTPNYFDVSAVGTSGCFDRDGHVRAPFELLPGGCLPYASADGWVLDSPTPLAAWNSRWRHRVSGRSASRRDGGHAARSDLGVRDVVS